MANEKPESDEQKTNIKYTDDFLALWNLFPKRAGGNSKPKAFKAFTARIRQNYLFTDICNGVKRYKAFCEASGKLNTEFVMMAATFFGPDEHFYEEWKLPRPPETLSERGIRLGIKPKPGESQKAYERRVMQHKGLNQGVPDAKSGSQDQTLPSAHTDQSQDRSGDREG